VSLRTEQLEIERAKRLDDNRFWGYSVFIFELRVPGAAIKATESVVSLVYPLAVNPESYSIEDPFTAQFTPGTNGGLVVEENGIIQRRIRLSGVSGFAPRRLTAANGFFGDTEVLRSYTKRGKFANDFLSGQRHLQFLQDKVFRTYADLKRDPTYAKQVQLHFHNTKEDEHWLVIPEMFNLQREASRGPLYRYEISLVAVAPSAHTIRTIGEKLPEKTFWDKLKDGVATARQAIAKISAYAEYITEVADEIKQVVRNVVAIVRDAINLVNTVSRIINGIARATADILNSIRSIATTCRDAAVGIADAVGNFPATIAQAFHNMADEFETLFSSKFFNELADRVTGPTTQLRQSRSNAVALQTATAGAAATPIRTNTDLQRAGTTPTLSDIVERLNSANLGVPLPNFTSLEMHEVGDSDTLPSISARYLGTASLWWVLAEANDLTHPYISDIPLPRTIRRGQTLLVPSTASHSNALGQSGTVLDRNEELTAQLLFRDAKLAQSSRYPNRLDLVMDIAGGGKDVAYVEGIENLKQAMRTRLETILGENVLYPSLGLPRIVGTGAPVVDAEIIRVLVSQAISADNRIANIGNVIVANETSPDLYEIEVDARVRGITAPIQVSTTRVA
jgi:hypothetical protein